MLLISSGGAVETSHQSSLGMALPSPLGPISLSSTLSDMSKARFRFVGTSLSITLIASLAVTRFISQQRALESTFMASPIGEKSPADVGIG